MKKTLVIFFLFITFFFILQADAQFLTLDDASIHYEVQGKGPAIVLIHGWGVSLDSWHFLFPELTDNYTVIRYDRRGCGKSDGTPDITLDPVDLKKLLDYLKIEQAVILGHSQGGEVAMRFVLTFPERSNGLILLGSIPPAGFGLSWNGTDALPTEMEKIAREKGIDYLKGLFSVHPIGNGFVAGTEGLTIMAKMFGDYEGKDLLNTKPLANATPAPDINRLSEISVPTLIITGELEMPYLQIVSDALDYAVANSERVVIKGGGHSVMLQQPESFNAEVKRFLSNIFPK